MNARRGPTTTFPIGSTLEEVQAHGQAILDNAIQLATELPVGYGPHVFTTGVVLAGSPEPNSLAEFQGTTADFLQADSNARLAAAQATIGQPTSGVTVKNGNTPDDVL